MKEIKIAILDLYNGEENQGMRCIKDLINEADRRFENITVSYDVFDVREKNELPGIDFDIYISSGGPGSPFEGEGSEWEAKYFVLLDNLTVINNNELDKKYILFICHSFQLMARYYKFAEVTERNSTSFGIMPIHKTEAGKSEPLFERLDDIFYGADFREYQVVQPKQDVLEKLGAEVIAIEKERPHVKYERAIMGVRISNEIIGLQFHPEADPPSMLHHLYKPERKEHVVSKYGEGKYKMMIKLAEDPNALTVTRNNVIPTFLNQAIIKLTAKEKVV